MSMVLFYVLILYTKNVSQVYVSYKYRMKSFPDFSCTQPTFEKKILKHDFVYFISSLLNLLFIYLVIYIKYV